MYSVANKLAQYGRGGDDTLVHMNKAEVAGLNALNHLVNNRPLSKNPVTGMPEAMDLTDILAGLGIGVAAMLTGGAAAAAAPALLGIEAGGLGALGVGAGAGALTGAALNTGKAAIKGDQDLGQAAMFGAGSGLLSGLGGAAGVGSEAAGAGSSVGNPGIAPNATPSAASSITPEFGAINPSTTPNLLGSSTPGLNSQLQALTPDFAQLGTSAVPQEAIQEASQEGIKGALQSGIAKEGMANAVQNSITPGFSNTAKEAITQGGAPGVWEQSFNNLKNVITNPGQHQTLLAAQVGAAGLEDQYKQQGLNEQAGAKQAADIVKQYKAAGIMPSELPKGLTDIANKYKGYAAGGTIRDVQGLGSIPTGYINQQPMANFYPQSMIPQAQPLQSTQPIRHNVIGYAEGGGVGYGYAEGGDVGGGDEGLLHGQGDGQSDGIAGLIEGAQGQEPVRLAEGEFVVPADVVSALGSGSTKAGAKALYDMLNRVRQQAYGHIQQTNPVNPQQVMPV